MRLDPRAEKNGMQKVRLRISNNGTSAWIPTGVYVEPSCFRDNLYDPITKKAYMWSEKREQLQALVRKFDEVLFELGRDASVSIELMTANEIRAYVVGERAPKVKKVCKASRGGSFLDFFDKYGHGRSSVNTQRHYAYVWRLLAEYCRDRNMRDMTFQDIDYPRLKDIREWVLNGRKDVTRYKVESYMRAAYKEAQRMKMVSRDDDPYLDYKVEAAARSTDEIDVIELEDLRRFLSLDLRNQQGEQGLSKARDILWASFCLCGVNLIDLYHLPKMHDDEIVYVRHKIQNSKNARRTHAAIGMEVEAVIERYAGKDHLFNWQELVPNYYTFQRRLNDRCSRLSKLNGAQVNMQLIRRTWATIAGEVGVDWHTVDKSLGHVDSEVTDIHYMRFNWEKAAEQNRKVIDYVLEGVVPNSVKVPKIFREK